MRTQIRLTSGKRRQSESRVQESYQVSGFSAGGGRAGKMVCVVAAAGGRCHASWVAVGQQVP